MEMTSAAEAARLVTLARNGDDHAFEALVRPLLPRAMGGAFLVTQNMVDAEDAVQEALMAAWRDVGSIRHPEAFPAWFRRLVLRAAIRQAARLRRETSVHVSTMDRSASVEDLDGAIWLRQAFNLLSPDDRAVVVARYYLGYSTGETAQLLGLPAGTVKSRLHYALARLRVAGGSDD